MDFKYCDENPWINENEYRYVKCMDILNILNISAKMFRSIYFHKKIINTFSIVGSSCVLMHLYNIIFLEFQAETNMILYQIEMHFIFLLTLFIG